MATQVKMYLAGLGGVIQGQFGSYQADSNGMANVDSRDVAALQTLGAVTVNSFFDHFNFGPVAPAAATAGKFVASAALSAGALTIANQPDVPRPAQVVIGAGTAAITAGSVTVTYVANDSTTHTDVISAVMAANASTTTYLSKGVVKFATVSVSAVSGGASPYVMVNSTADLAVPVAPGAVNFALVLESVGTGPEAGTALASVLGGITPHSAPNGTLNYSALYTYLAPAI